MLQIIDLEISTEELTNTGSDSLASTNEYFYLWNVYSTTFPSATLEKTLNGLGNITQ